MNHAEKAAQEEVKMKLPNTTDCFPAEVKPVHVGVYQTDAMGEFDTYQYWNGDFWGRYKPTPEKADEAGDRPSSVQSPRWRGLAENPNAA